MWIACGTVLAVCAVAVLWRGVGAIPIKPELKRPLQVSVTLPPEKPPVPTAHKESPAAQKESLTAQKEPPVSKPHEIQTALRQPAPPARTPAMPPPSRSVEPAAHAVMPPLPPRAAGEPAWLRYAVPARETDGKPMIAVVIDDMGVDHRRSIQALALPGPMTMAFLPYARDLGHMTRAARAVGHELLLHMPMEPLSAKENPGPNAIVTGLDPVELRRRADAMLDSFGGYVGVNNHMGSKFTQDVAGMRIVLEDLEARGLLFLDSRTIGNTAGPSVARSLGMPFAERDVFLDNDSTTGNVRAKLAEVEAVARRQGHAIAIGHPHDGTVEALAQWLPDIEKRGFVLVPVSAIVKLRMEACGGQAGMVKVSNC
ncbi:MAG: divergent polysaccharide deacetylase family protein [Alphaproteobacteria bacterium]